MTERQWHAQIEAAWLRLIASAPPPPASISDEEWDRTVERIAWEDRDQECRETSPPGASA